MKELIHKLADEGDFFEIQKDFAGNIIIGVLGAVVGGFLFGLLGISTSGGLFGQLITAVAGALVLLWVARFFRK